MRCNKSQKLALYPLIATGIHSNLIAAITAGMRMKEAAVAVKNTAEPIYASHT